MNMMTNIWQILKVSSALIAVALIAIITLKLIQKFITRKGIFKPKSNVKVLGIFYVDQHNKIIEIERSNKKHLIMLGKNNDFLIESYESKQESL